MSATAPSDSPIERYLDDLATAGSGLPVRTLRHLLNETEAHLRDAAGAEQSRGVPQTVAEERAVARFGPARELVRAERAAVTPLRVLATQTLRTALLLGGLGAVAVGLSGAVAAVIRAIGGNAAVAAVGSGRTLTASDCAGWLHAYPGSSSCRAAAVADWADEIVYYRLAAGVLGVVALAVAMLLIRRARRASQTPPLLDARVSDTIGAGAFAAAALWTLFMGVDAVVADSGRGAGQWFSATPIAAAGAVVFAVRLVGELRSRPAMH